MRLQPNGPKSLTNAFKHFGRGRLYISQFVIESEFLPFVTTQLMKREHLNSLHCAEVSGELCDKIDVIRVISEARH